jgi:hypothetical protein
MIHDSPTHSALYLEELALCGLNVMSEEFREKMTGDHRILYVANIAMILADLDIEDRFKVLDHLQLDHLQRILGVIRKETGKSLSENWIGGGEVAA